MLHHIKCVRYFTQIIFHASWMGLCSSHRRQFYAPYILHCGCLIYSVLWYSGILQQCLWTCGSFFPFDCPCKVSFHLVPMVLLVLVRIIDIRDKAEVKPVSFQTAINQYLTSSPLQLLQAVHSPMYISSYATFPEV